MCDLFESQGGFERGLCTRGEDRHVVAQVGQFDERKLPHHVVDAAGGRIELKLGVGEDLGRQVEDVFFLASDLQGVDDCVELLGVLGRAHWVELHGSVAGLHLHGCADQVELVELGEG